MDLEEPIGGCWPTSTQELLLKACLLNGSAAAIAWEAWIAQVELAQLDAGSERLLPLLYKNLCQQKIETPHLKRLKQVYRQTWYRNQLTFHRLMDPLKTLHHANIPALLLKGSALSIEYYRDFGVRPMSDFDFLVPWHQALPAIDLLKSMSWQPQMAYPFPLTPAYLRHIHALAFRIEADNDRNEADYELELHWNLQPEHLQPDVDADLWQRAMPIEFNRIPVFALSSTDQFFHTCVHGVRWDAVPPLRWVTDAHAILQHSPDLNWEQLLALAQHRKLILPLREAMLYLDRLLPGLLPVSVMGHFQTVPIPLDQQAAYRIRIQPGQREYAVGGPAQVLKRYLPHAQFMWQSYLQSSATQGSAPTLVGFLRMLQRSWQVPKLWQVPFVLLARAGRVSWKLTAQFRSCLMPKSEQ